MALSITDLGKPVLGIILTRGFTVQETAILRRVCKLFKDTIDTQAAQVVKNSAITKAEKNPCQILTQLIDFLQKCSIYPRSVRRFKGHNLGTPNLLGAVIKRSASPVTLSCTTISEIVSKDGGQLEDWETSENVLQEVKRRISFNSIEVVKQKIPLTEQHDLKILQRIPVLFTQAH